MVFRNLRLAKKTFQTPPPSFTVDTRQDVSRCFAPDSDPTICMSQQKLIFVKPGVVFQCSVAGFWWSHARCSLILFLIDRGGTWVCSSAPDAHLLQGSMCSDHHCCKPVVGATLAQEVSAVSGTRMVGGSIAPRVCWSQWKSISCTALGKKALYKCQPFKKTYLSLFCCRSLPLISLNNKEFPATELPLTGCY